jgi:ankyrin repeat protein
MMWLADLYLILTQDGTTALIMAATKGHTSVATLLLDAKADANHADNVSHAFFFRVIRWSAVRTLQLEFGMMCIILLQNHTTWFDRLVFDFEQFYIIQQSGQTPLLLAVVGGHAEVVTLLLDAKADITYSDTVSYTSLWFE